MRINFFGPPSQAYSADSTFRVVSFVDVLRGRVDPSTWRGGLVLVGALGATGLADDYWTPTSDQGRKMAGVEIHANAAATLFSMNFMRTTPAAAQVALFVGLALAMALLAARASVVGALVLGPLFLGALALADLLVLYAWGLLIPVATPLLFGLAAFIGELAPRLATEQRQAKAARAALDSERVHDQLTGLANRSHLSIVMRELLQLSAQGPFALLVLDLDRFKDINDTLGHGVGDVLLQQLAHRLTTALAGSGAHIARLGGDEFAVLLPDATSAQAIAVSESLRQALEVPTSLGARMVSVGASIGIALCPQHGNDPDTLLRHADAAMYAAKRGRSGQAVYSLDQEHTMAERLEMVSALREAISGDELRLHYQPKVECQTGRVRGVEALARWQHASQGIITPDRFVPLAEQTGLIGPLTRWVLEAAVRQARAWLDSGLPLRIAVNLSTHDLQDPRLPAQVCELLERYDVPFGLLSLEITETALLADPGRALETLNELAGRGVEASLDDFGTGYSSLTYLRQLPLRELKIDASFVRGLADAQRDRAIVRSTIELGHRLGLSVVAEGVEDGITLELLAELGCDEAQGYYLSRPLPADELADWLLSADNLESRRANAA
jgi:diguanylate cyclase (GGDEF)-like protein